MVVVGVSPSVTDGSSVVPSSVAGVVSLVVGAVVSVTSSVAGVGTSLLLLVGPSVMGDGVKSVTVPTD